MVTFSLSFLLGIVLLQQCAELPSIYLASAVSCVLLLLNAIFYEYRLYLKIFFFMSLGLIWCLIYIYFHTSWNLPAAMEGKNGVVTGYIASIPIKEQNRTTFLLDLKTVHHKPARGLIHLSWQNHSVAKLRVGDAWQLTVRLKKIHSTRNPGSFDYEAFYFQRGVRAAGYVIDRENKQINPSIHFYYVIDRIRQYLRDLIAENLPPSHTSPWITALAIGEREGIPPEDWDVLRNTGTNHLMAIAGLHIGFLSGLMFTVMSWIWRSLPYLPLIMPAHIVGSLSALLIALLYSAMAGFSIPTQRAAIMISFFLISIYMRRKVLPWQAWSLALLLVLLINPLSVLTDSFWLSFYSVALIIYGMSARLSPKGWWWKHGRLQWIISIGLIPLSIWLFQECSLVSFIANSLAIPVIGLLIVPLTVIGTLALVISVKFIFILQWADKILQWLWTMLAFFAKKSWGSLAIAINPYWILISACLGVLLLLMPRGLRGRGLGIIFILPVLLYKPAVIPNGYVILTLLDVGQGLSAIVQTKNHVLLYDTGARLSAAYDMGASVILPYLRSQGIKTLDMLIVSHGDNDHSGGAQTVLKQMPSLLIKTSVPELFPNIATLCLQGERWQWDQVDFEFVYPDQNNLGLGNDSSCVLRISTGKQHILLTGDIEKWAEKKLLQQKITADILIAPHHGSKTSGMDDFINAVNPNIVLFPVGYRNRYHFPHASVITKYQDRKVKMYHSVTSGALQFVLDGQSDIQSPSQYRIDHKRYWNRDESPKKSF